MPKLTHFNESQSNNCLELAALGQLAFYVLTFQLHLFNTYLKMIYKHYSTFYAYKIYFFIKMFLQKVL